MANIKRSSAENMFSKKGNVQPQKKKSVEEILIDTPVNEEEIIVPEMPTIDEKSKKEVTIDTTDTKITEKDEPSSQQSEHQISKTNINKLFNKQNRKEKGKQRTIYFKKNVYDFIEGIATEYGYGMSDVVNKLIETIMEDEE